MNETKENEPQQSLALPPVIYTPRFDEGVFVEDFDNTNYSADTFQTNGIKCSCPSNNIFYNRSSFIHQHCKGVRHKKYIQGLNVNDRRIIEEHKEQEEEIRNLRINVQRLTNASHRRQREIAELNNRIIELSSEVLHLRNSNTNIRNERDNIENRLNTYIEMVKNILREDGYEFP